ncbi:efflux RND transporter periplasmic adaptor subunit [Frigidibacter sp. ROC022]|uniref:efflux RND transporter periplasmic adaptor subunit n=1 Tax=Frigidibacter sp. ROC022 TaxID=2971796 RepID=UPI00215B4511|nr:efflux RND transporter periplasmic adaptor subunit [Frigidibacter sp. ROC022]MCR8726329.1 efflux RND transporter periplasmic adaptor subunit [Frigidibacter sp. ROC022]
MRLFPILTAALVGAALYALVMERDWLLQLAGRDPAAEAAADPEPEPELAPPAEQEAAAQRPVKVVSLLSRAQEVPNAVLVRGRTEAARQVEVRAETSGLVISEPTPRGARVSEGDLLCRLDPGTREQALAEAEARLAEARAHRPETQARIAAAEAALSEAQARIPEAEARLAEAEARLAEAELAYRQAESLKDQGFASDNQLNSAQSALQSARAGASAAKANVTSVSAGVRSAEAAIEQARAAVQATEAGILAAEAGVGAARREIEKLEIRAPFSGLLETDSAERGSLLQPGGLCATVVQLDRILLVGFISETEIAKVREGARAGARLADGREVAGQVSFLSRAADEATRTFRVEVTVDNPDLSIRDGQTVEILIESDPARAHLLPASALTLDDDGRLGVRLVADGLARFHPVSVVRDSQDGMLITGLPDEAEVIVVGQDYVTDGVAVEATRTEGL